MIRRISIAALAALSLSGVLAAHPTAAIGPKIEISKGVWDNFQAYLAHVGRIGEGYYAVTEDGQGGGSWACGNGLCMGSFDARSEAIRRCEAANPGKTCLIFARDGRIKMDYEVAP